MTGVTSTNLSNRPAKADEFLVNNDGSTGLLTFINLALQLIGEGPLADALQEVRGLVADKANWKTPVLVATTGPIGTLSGEKTIDTVVTNLSRVLAWQEANPAVNGIYITSPGPWVRVSDANQSAEVLRMAVYVQKGAVNGGKQFICTAPGPIEVDVTPLPFEIISDQVALNAAIQTITNTMVRVIINSGAGPLVFADRRGFKAFEVTASGGIRTPSLEIGGTNSDPGALLTIRDRLGFIAAQLRIDGKPNIGFGASGAAGGNSVESFNSYCLAISAKTSARYNSAVARAYWEINHIIAYGQSLARGSLTWPRQFTEQYGNLMLGNSVQITNQSATDYPTFGPAILKPLVCTVTNGATLYTDEQVAAFAPDQPAWGVTPAEVAIAFLKKLWLQGEGKLADTSKVFVPTINGRGATQISALMKGASPNYYGQIPDGTAKVKAAADQVSKTSGLAGVIHIHGEADYTQNTSKADYNSRNLQIFSDIGLDAKAVYGNIDPPAIFITQAGGIFTNDASNLAVAMAQIELADENPNVYLVGPNFFVPNRDDGHLTSNGSRWLGFMIGKVMYKVLIRGEGWRPLQPLAAKVIDGAVHIGFHVPVGPLAWGMPYDGRTAVDYPGKGFRLYDTLGDVGFVPEIVADAVVRLTPSRAIQGGARVRYAGKATYNGNGCLRDSDPLTSSGLYEYLVGSGMQPDENIFQLTGKPYPLHNWCCAFDIAID